MDSVEADQAMAFLAVLDTGSFSAAGRKIGRDGSIISRRVAALETRLGTRLLERSTRRVSTTEAGARFRDRMREALDMVHGAEADARAMASTPSGLLRVSLPTTFGRLWIAPRLPEFLSLYPSLRLEACYADRYVDLVADGFDVAIRIGEMQDSRLISKPLAPTHRLVCAAPGYLAHRSALRTADDLLQHDCLGFTPMATYPIWHLERAGKQRAVRVSGRLESDDVMTLVEAAVAGVGVMMAANWLVARELADGRLVKVLPDWMAKGEMGVNVVRASTRHAPAKTRVFIEWITRVFASAPWDREATGPAEK